MTRSFKHRLGEPGSTPRGSWTITCMLFTYMLINFADKAIVGLAAVPIMTELKLTPKEFGLLGSSFFLLFSFSGIFVGFIANWAPTRWVILVLALSWALVQFPMTVQVSFAVLVICRILLGAGEGPAFSVAMHGLYKWFPDEKRTLPTAVVTQGSAMGVILALPALNWVIIRYSWHWAFFALGTVGLLWALFWLYFGREGPLDAKGQHSAKRRNLQPISYQHLLLQPTFIGCCLASFGAYWALSLGLTWFTPFLINGLGFSQASAGLLSTLPWITGAIVVLATGWLSQTLLGRGISSRTARCVLGSLPLVLGGLMVLMVAYLDNPICKVALLAIGAGLTGSIYVVCPPIIAEFTPVPQRGAVMAIYGAVFTAAGILAPAFNGSIINGANTLLEGYYLGYKVTAGFQIFGGLGGLLLLWLGSEKMSSCNSDTEQTVQALLPSVSIPADEAKQREQHLPGALGFRLKQRDSGL